MKTHESTLPTWPMALQHVEAWVKLNYPINIHKITMTPVEDATEPIQAWKIQYEYTDIEP